MPEARAPETAPCVDITHLAGLDALHVDSLALFAYAGATPLSGVADLVDWRLGGRIAQAQARGHFRGGLQDLLLVPAPARLEGAKVFVFGLGDKDELTEDGVHERLQQALQAVAAAGGRKLALVLPSGDAPHRCTTDLRSLFLAAKDTPLGHIISKILVG